MHKMTDEPREPDIASAVPRTVLEEHQAAMLSWMQEIAPYGILTTDNELKVQSWNEWLETYSGLAAPMVKGRALLDLFPDIRERKLDEHFRRALAGEVIVLSATFHSYLLPLPSPVREPGVTHMQQTVRIAPLSLHGRVRGTITIIEDVTQRQVQAAALARQHQRDQLLSSSLVHLLRTRDPEGLIRELFPKVAEHLNLDTFLNYLVEPDGKFMRLHAAAGISEEERQQLGMVPLTDTSLSGKAATEQRPIIVNHLQSTGEPQFAIHRVLGIRAAACHPLMVSDRLIGTLTFASHHRDAFTAEEIEIMATISHYVAVALDRAITDTVLRRVQLQLADHARDLENKVHERTAKLQDTIVQLESFSYTVAHDLRAPIRALKSYAQLLLEETTPDFPETWLQYLNRIKRAAFRLDAITRDLLQFSTISRQDIQLSTVDLHEVIQDIQLLQPVLNEEALAIHHPLHSVLGHRTLLQHCLSNLLDNAVKFVKPNNRPHIVIRSEVVEGHATPAGKAAPSINPVVGMTISAHPAPADDRRVRIWVEDNGIGIAPEWHDKIFGIFERLNSPEKYEGTGIGLAIVARAMQRMGGSCGVISTVGQGSRFWLELPVGQSG